MSLGLSTYTAFTPSAWRINANYALILGVIGSGVVLTLQKTAHLPQACLSGILYLSVVVFSLIMAHRKLAREIAAPTNF